MRPVSFNSVSVLLGVGVQGLTKYMEHYFFIFSSMSQRKYASITFTVLTNKSNDPSYDSAGIVHAIILPHVESRSNQELSKRNDSERRPHQ